MELLNTVESNNLQCYNVCCKRTLLPCLCLSESQKAVKWRSKKTASTNWAQPLSDSGREWQRSEKYFWEAQSLPEEPENIKCKLKFTIMHRIVNFRTSERLNPGQLNQNHRFWILFQLSMEIDAYIWIPYKLHIIR